MLCPALPYGRAGQVLPKRPQKKASVYCRSFILKDFIRAGPEPGTERFSSRHAAIDRANLGALRGVEMALAFDTEIGVDYVYIPFGNGINRAFRQADPAGNAIFRYLKRQNLSPPFRIFVVEQASGRGSFVYSILTHRKPNYKIFLEGYPVLYHFPAAFA
jgi:hypothetical protein